MLAAGTASIELKHGRIAGFDGLRAIAAIMVFLEHRAPGGPLHLGGYGVRLFFVLSGYLIIGGIVRSDGSNKSAAIRSFFINRAFRIFPIYALTLVGAAFLLAFGVTTAVSWKEIGYSAIFAGNIYFGHVLGHWTTALSHTWSLSVEEQFYLVVAPLILMCGKRWSLALCGALIAAAGIQLALLTAGHASAVVVGVDSFIGFGAIALGGLIYQIGPSIRRGMNDTAALVLLVAYFASPLLLRSIDSAWFGMVGSALMAAGLIFGVAMQQDSTAVRILEWRPLAQLGRISYGFYLYHYWLTAEALNTMSFGLIDVRPANPSIQIIVLFAATLAMAALSWRVIEKPAMRQRSRLFHPQKARRPLCGGRGVPLAHPTECQLGLQHPC